MICCCRFYAIFVSARLEFYFREGLFFSLAKPCSNTGFLFFRPNTKPRHTPERSLLAPDSLLLTSSKMLFFGILAPIFQTFAGTPF